MNERKGTIIGLLNLCGGISGLLSIAALIFFGGGLVEKVRALEVRMTVVERDTGPVAREHIKLDELRDETTRDRLQSHEEAIKAFSRIEADVREISVKLDALKERTVKTQMP